MLRDREFWRILDTYAHDASEFSSQLALVHSDWSCHYRNLHLILILLIPCRHLLGIVDLVRIRLLGLVRILRVVLLIGLLSIISILLLGMSLVVVLLLLVMIDRLSVLIHCLVWVLGMLSLPIRLARSSHVVCLSLVVGLIGSLGQIVRPGILSKSAHISASE